MQARGVRVSGETTPCGSVSPSSFAALQSVKGVAEAAKVRHLALMSRHFAVSEKVETLYSQPAQLPADAIGPKMARLRREHHRLLGNGWCTRPPQLDCAFESICETCTYFQTTIDFRPTIAAQHDHAAAHGQTSRQELFAQLLTRIDGAQAS